MKCVVPIVTLATFPGSSWHALNMAVRALFIPWLGLDVVQALCHARMPRLGAVEWVGSRITPSVFVLWESV